MKIEDNKFEAAPPPTEFMTVPRDGDRIPTRLIRRRRSPRRRAWGPLARFFLRWLFRRMNG